MSPLNHRLSSCSLPRTSSRPRLRPRTEIIIQTASKPTSSLQYSARGGESRVTRHWNCHRTFISFPTMTYANPVSGDPRYNSPSKAPNGAFEVYPPHHQKVASDMRSSGRQRISASDHQPPSTVDGCSHSPSRSEDQTHPRKANRLLHSPSPQNQS